MLAALAAQPGPIHNVTIQDVPEPDAPQRGEVIVRMLASTFNPSDAVTVSGAYASRTEFPLVPGFEGVGVVERIGPEVPSALLGRRVLPIGSAGAWQELKRTDHTWCIPVPDDIPTDVACFVYINPLTAYLMVERFCGDARTVLIDGASTTIARHLQELLDQRGIQTVMVGRGWSGEGVDKHVEPPDQGVLDELTPREHEVLRLIALGLSNEEIAVAEYVSMATVKTHVRHILMKTNSRDRVQAVLCAYRNGLVTTEELLRHPLD